MKDTTFSHSIKKALMAFGGIQVLNWNLKDILIDEKEYTFQVETKDFVGGFAVKSTDNENYSISFATLIEGQTLCRDNFRMRVESREQVVKINGIVDYMEKAFVHLGGHRAPQCTPTPSTNS